jgi:hypothetical protein
MWYDERVNKRRDTPNPEFSMCCMQGRIEIAPFKRLPRPLYDLYYKNDKRSKYFLENIRSFNSMFAFTSLGGKTHKTNNDGKAPPIFVMNGENYHRIGSLLPTTGNQPKFAQLYIYDTDNEIKNRMAAVRYCSLKAFLITFRCCKFFVPFLQILIIMFLCDKHVVWMTTRNH